MNQFDEWLDSIEQRPNKYIDQFTIKDLIFEAGQKYGNPKRNLSIAEINEIFESWIGVDVMTMEKEDVLVLLRDFFEMESQPIADCHDCAVMGKVCFENDGGLSHRISQYQATD